MSPVEAVAAGEILGRGDELTGLRSFVSEIPAGPASFLLEGEPGIGKTTLWW